MRGQIQKKDTAFTESFPAADRLAITLPYLESGETQQPLLYSYGIGKSIVSTIIGETCIPIYTALKDRDLKRPSTEDDWKAIAERFEEIWNFPHVFPNSHKCPNSKNSRLWSSMGKIPHLK